MHPPESSLSAPGYALPDLETFGAALIPDAPRHKALRELHALLGKLDPNAELSERVDRLESLSRWVRASGKLPPTEDAELSERSQVHRFRVLVRALERFGAIRSRVQAVLAPTLAELQPIGLFARSGLPADRGLFGETMDRLSRTFLPEPIDERALGQFVARLFPARRDALFLSSIPAELVERFARTLAHDGSEGVFAPLHRGVGDAMSLIALRVGAVGLYEAIRVRSPELPVRSSPFYLLPRAVDEVVVAIGPSGSPDRRRAAKNDCLALIAACERTVAAVIQNLEHAGVSVDVVYRLELITKNLGRLELLLERATDEDPLERVVGAKRVLVRLLEARRNDRELGQIITSNLHLLARKIIERAGETGEHYITSTRGEYLKMLLSAAGGGFLTCGTTVLKYLIAWAHFAPFVEGALSAVNYAGSFIVMQFLGFTLATKQPSMTAAALAGSMRASAAEKDLTGLITTIARITRSQLAAAIGNIFAVIPTAVVFDTLYARQTGGSFLDADTANYVIHSLHPTESGTIFYAALTGVLLWTSSVGAGWLENWAVYRRLPEAIAEHRSQRFIGKRATAFLSRVFSRNIAGIGGNATLGFLLGMTPVAGKFFGLPLDVRHVTLSAGALSLAVCSLGLETLRKPEFLAAALGIAVIGALNFGVSFVLALLVALRAREVDRRDRLRMWVSVALTFVRSPLQFFLPPSAPDQTPVHGPVSVHPPPVAPRDGH